MPAKTLDVESLQAKTGNIYETLSVMSKRARQIATGGRPALVEEENDKPTVIALREIEEGLVTADILTEVVQDYEIVDSEEVAEAAETPEAPAEPAA